MGRCMTLIAASIAVESAAELDSVLDRAGECVRAGATMIEWRVDELALETDGIRSTLELVRRSPAPCILACRPAWEGGEYGGEEAHRVALFEAVLAADQRPRYIDLELKAWRGNPAWRTMIRACELRRDLTTGLMLSVHDFRSRPADLLQRMEAMVLEPRCAVVKLAWQARSLRDNLEAFELLAARQKPMIALCMGRFGVMSRVLAPKFGGLLTYAAADSASPTAPGQLTVPELVRTYRFAQLGHRTRVYGVIGWPAEHSLGPVIHNAGFDAVGHDGVYLPLPVPPEYEHFKATVGAMIDDSRLSLRGASVTIPHKENLLRFVRDRGGRLDECVERIGAVNTLVVGSAGGMACLNTDSTAAVEALCANLDVERSDLMDKEAAILGAGGAARAVAAALLEAGVKVTVFNRTPQRAEELRDQMGGVAIADRKALSRRRFDVYVNCTPLGMSGGPAPDQSPLPPDAPLDDSVTVMDTVYAPQRTPLICEAESRGARVITGMDMFLRQAAGQFEQWTGVPGPIETFKTAIRSHNAAAGAN